jgi:hypothetical protein
MSSSEKIVVPAGTGLKVESRFDDLLQDAADLTGESRVAMRFHPS